jgi:acyl-ACP thioesterase
VAETHRVAYSDIDFNRHMNTMRYIDFAFDALPIEIPENLKAVRVDLNFMKEALYGDTLSLLHKEEESRLCFEFRNDAGEPLCRMALEIK